MTVPDLARTLGRVAAVNRVMVEYGNRTACVAVGHLPDGRVEVGRRLVVASGECARCGEPLRDVDAIRPGGFG